MGFWMQTGWLDNDTFCFYVPVTALDVVKAGEKDDGKRWIQGIASTDSKDLQGEIVDQKGIDFTYFLEHGWFNDDHKAGPENKVGLPTECRVTKQGLWVKGFLLKNHARADHYWELMQSLKTSGSDRKVGFSIQGKVKRRNGSRIAECWIQDIALTPAPVNTTTWADIAKSLSTMEWDLSKDEDEAEKAQTSQSVVVPESLDKEEKVSKSLSHSEAVDYLCSEHELPREAASAVADLIFEVF